MGKPASATTSVGKRGQRISLKERKEGRKERTKEKDKHNKKEGGKNGDTGWRCMESLIKLSSS